MGAGARTEEEDRNHCIPVSVVLVVLIPPSVLYTQTREWLGAGVPVRKMKWGVPKHYQSRQKNLQFTSTKDAKVQSREIT